MNPQDRNKPRLTLVSALSALDDALAGGGGNLAPPVGVLTLAAILQPHYEVTLIDLDSLWSTSPKPDFQQLALNAIRDSQPDFLGFSTISGSYPATIRLAQACSQTLPTNIPIIFGGPQASVVDSATLTAFPFIHSIVRGEADDTFPQLLHALAHRNHPGLIPGITFRSGSSIVRNPNAPPIHDLDALPIPAFDLLSYNLEDRGLPIEAGRGCPFACTFCSTNDFFRRKFRLRSPQRILADMRELNSRYGTTSFSLTHDMFTVDRKRVVDICQTFIAAGSPFRWSCSARTDCIDRELLHLMRDAGCFDIFFGIETGSQRMQKVIQKDLDMQTVRDIFHHVDAAGIKSTASIIVGYPQETPEDLRESVRFYGDMLRYSTVEPQFNILSPLAATPLTEEFKDSLYLDSEWTTISESGRAQTEADQHLIQQYPQIFQSFYALPSQTPRPLLRRLRDFLYAGGVRCGSLLYALHLHTGNLLDVFHHWEAAGAGEQPEDWYYSLGFSIALVEFADKEYAPRDLAIRTAADFYRRVFDVPPEHPIGNGTAAALALDQGVRVLDCAFNIHALIKAFRTTGQRPPDAALHRPVTAVIRHLPTGKGTEILEFPTVTTEILRHAQSGTADLDHVIADFERRNLGVAGFTAGQVVYAAIEMLTNRQLLAASALQPLV